MAQAILEQLKCFRARRDGESVGEYVDEIQTWLYGRSLAEEEVLSQPLNVGRYDLCFAVAAQKMGVTSVEVKVALEIEEEMREELEDEDWDDEDEDWDE